MDYVITLVSKTKWGFSPASSLPILFIPFPKLIHACCIISNWWPHLHRHQYDILGQKILNEKSKTKYGQIIGNQIQGIHGSHIRAKSHFRSQTYFPKLEDLPSFEKDSPSSSSKNSTYSREHYTSIWKNRYGTYSAINLISLIFSHKFRADTSYLPCNITVWGFKSKYTKNSHPVNLYGS